MKHTYPFNKWDKDKIIKIIVDNGFSKPDEDGGIYQFHIGENTFENSYIIYLRRTGLFICDPNVRIAPMIKSYKKLNQELMNIHKERRDINNG